MSKNGKLVQTQIKIQKMSPTNRTLRNLKIFGPNLVDEFDCNTLQQCDFFSFSAKQVPLLPV